MVSARLLDSLSSASWFLQGTDAVSHLLDQLAGEVRPFLLVCRGPVVGPVTDHTRTVYVHQGPAVIVLLGAEFAPADTLAYRLLLDAEDV
jgi:hypothetical protein